VVFVFGLATFMFAADDELGRRLVAVQLAASKVASVAEVASASGVDTLTLWRWTCAFAAGGVWALAFERRGPKGPSKLTEELVARIVALDGEGLSLRQIATQTGVSTSTARVALAASRPRRLPPRRPLTPSPSWGPSLSWGPTAAAATTVFRVLAWWCWRCQQPARTVERVAARFGT